MMVLVLFCLIGNRGINIKYNPCCSGGLIIVYFKSFVMSRRAGWKGLSLCLVSLVLMKGFGCEQDSLWRDKQANRLVVIINGFSCCTPTDLLLDVNTFRPSSGSGLYASFLGSRL